MANKWTRNKVAKTLGLSEKPKPLTLHPNALDLTEIDKDVFHDLVDQYDAMADNLDNGLNEYAPFDYLSEDLFNSLFKYNANLREEDEMKAFSQYNHQMMSEIMESEQFQDLRKSTKFDMMGSAIGTEVLQNQAMEQIMYYKGQLQKQRETGQKQPGADAGEYIEQLNNMKNTQDAIDDLTGGTGSADGLTQKEAAELARLQEQLKQQQQSVDQNQSGQHQLNKGMQDAAKSGAKKAKSAVDEVRDIVNSWGLDSGGSGKRIPLDDRRKAIERIRRSPRLKNLTDLIGRMKRLALDKKKQKLPDGHSIKSIEVGNKIESVTPSEMMKLASPTMKKDFTRRYHQKQLLQYKKEDIQNTGRGPVLVLHDKSGSMQGHKDDWSTALALATLEVAQKEKRNYAYIPYTNYVTASNIKDIKAGELAPDDVLDIAEMPATGGTNFMEPLRHAVEFLSQSNYKKGDILFITDGDAGVSEDFLKEFNKVKQDKQFYVNTVLINTDGGASRATVARFSDNIVTISSIAELDEGNANQIFRMVEDENKFQDPNAAANQSTQP